MSVLSPISAADSGGGTPIFLSPPIGCDEAEFPILLRRYRLGLALFVAAIGMLFVGFSSAYVVRRGIPIYDAGTGGYSTDWEPLRLPIRLLLFNSCLLICASVAMEVVRRKTSAFVYPSETNGREVTLWLSASLLLGTGFLLGQGIAWHALVSSGRFLRTGARTAFFYVLTGTHALHALLGVLAVAAIAGFGARISPARRYVAVDLTAWYLHAMTLLWVYLLCFLLFA